MQNQPKTHQQRTAQQNAALHVYFGLIADRLNAAGFDLKHVLARAPVAIPCTAHNIKENIWKPIMFVQIGENSTTKMNTTDIDPIFHTVNRFLAENFGISEPWPSIKEILFQMREPNYPQNPNFDK